MSDVFNLVDDEDEFLLQGVDHAFMLSPPLPSVPGTSEPPVLLATRPDAPKIRVIVRKRPLNKKELDRGESDVLECDADASCLYLNAPRVTVDLTLNIDRHSFRFDDVFDEHVDNDQLYERAIQPLVGTAFRQDVYDVAAATAHRCRHFNIMAQPSHGGFSLHVSSHYILCFALRATSELQKTLGQLSFIDLAGSERWADTYDNDKQTRLEVRSGDQQELAGGSRNASAHLMQTPGEIHELKLELNAVDKSKKKDAVKKVIAAMTVGKDVSPLFPDVINQMQTDDMELKKLVYLYLINYAKTQPDLAIMAVNTFVKDSQDPNPLIRALAVRTMGCIRVDKITEYLCDPLHRCLKDEDPYVRKTAAVCVAKLYDISAELVEDRGFLDMLKDLLGDANPMVVANAVAALSEIQELGGKPVLDLTLGTVSKLLRALNECTEWGQVFILDSVVNYMPADAKDAEAVVERVLPRLQHANAAVVLSAIKVILRNIQYIGDESVRTALLRKLAPPLVTLLGSEPELQYVALRNISIIIQAQPSVLANDVKVFFCKYNDPSYVKMEKLDIMMRLVNERNIDQVLLEFKEYATEVDVDFVRKAVRAIGFCAISIQSAAERCINVLLELIQTKVNYVVQESIIVIKDIFRRYPNRYESIIGTLCDSLESLDEPEAKASMVWIIGEYSERIDNADELLEQFLETFPEETAAVQLALMTATVKLFLKKPMEKPQQLIQLVLTYATQETDNPDLRDRAYIYWRLLSTDPEAAKDVVLAEKPTISGAQDSTDPALLEELLRELGTLASVYHKPAASFVSKMRLAVHRADDLAAAAVRGSQNGEPEMTSVVVVEASQAGSAPTAIAAPAAMPDLLGDLLDVRAPAGAMSAAPDLPVVFGEDKGKGVVLRAALTHAADAYILQMSVCNLSMDVPVEGPLLIQFNRNALGLAPASQSVSLDAVLPGATAVVCVPLVQRQELVAPDQGQVLQVALKFPRADVGVLYFASPIASNVHL
ncbi:Beta-adaptin-like protein C [Chlorella vulgaris]